tara:strand:- start:789 stop:1430 length:642 start_codon:yes stop_codon:yes gene_type:complete
MLFAATGSGADGGKALLALIALMFGIFVFYAAIIAIYLWRQIKNFFLYVTGPIRRPIGRLWNMYSVWQRKCSLRDNLKRYCKVELDDKELKAMTEQELSDMYARSSVANNLEKYCDIKVDFREHTLEELRHKPGAKKRKPKGRPKMATVKASEVKLCSKGIMIPVPGNRFILVEGNADEMKELAKQLFRTGNYLDKPKPASKRTSGPAVVKKV